LIVRPESQVRARWSK